jgi:gamma-glutamylcyclotransferase (GGCT)/AIG2-like uncharacterized protein YtfP
MSNGANYLFVYGTLLPGKAPREIAPVVQKLRPLGDGFVRGRLYDLGQYPGAIPAKTGQLITGKIFEIPEEPDLLKRLDEYEEFDAEKPEGSLFLRKKLPVTRTAGNQRLLCWIYVYKRRPEPPRPSSTRSRNRKSRR